MMCSTISPLGEEREFTDLEQRLVKNDQRLKLIHAKTTTLNSKIQKSRAETESKYVRVLELKRKYSIQFSERKEVFKLRRRLRNDKSLRSHLETYFHRKLDSQNITLPLEEKFLEAEIAWIEIDAFERKISSLKRYELRSSTYQKKLADLEKSLDQDVQKLAQRYLILGREPTQERPFADCVKAKIKELSLPQYEIFQKDIADSITEIRKLDHETTDVKSSIIANLNTIIRRQQVLEEELYRTFGNIVDELVACLEKKSVEMIFLTIERYGKIMKASPSLAVRLLKRIPLPSSQEVRNILFEHLPRGSIPKLVITCLTSEVQECAIRCMTHRSSVVTTLFRGDSFSEKFPAEFQTSCLKIFFQTVLVEINTQCTSLETLELDPYLAKDKLENNQHRMIDLATQVLLKIKTFLNEHQSEFPNKLKVTYQHFFNQLRFQIPGHERIQLASFFFLRFICPAISAPENGTTTRNGILLSKILQSVVNCQVSEQEWMKFIAPFIQSQQPTINQIVDLLLK